MFYILLTIFNHFRSYIPTFSKPHKTYKTYKPYKPYKP